MYILSNVHIIHCLLYILCTLSNVHIVQLWLPSSVQTWDTAQLPDVHSRLNWTTGQRHHRSPHWRSSPQAQKLKPISGELILSNCPIFLPNSQLVFFHHPVNWSLLFPLLSSGIFCHPLFLTDSHYPGVFSPKADIQAADAVFKTLHRNNIMHRNILPNVQAHCPQVIYICKHIHCAGHVCDLRCKNMHCSEICSAHICTCHQIFIALVKCPRQWVHSGCRALTPSLKVENGPCYRQIRTISKNYKRQLLQKRFQ